MNVAIENGYSIIRIMQEDIWFNKNNWKEKFIKVFKEYNSPKIIFIGCDKKYNRHMI